MINKHNINFDSLPKDTIVAYELTRKGRVFAYSAMYKGLTFEEHIRVLIQLKDGRTRLIQPDDIFDVKDDEFWKEETYNRFLESKIR